MKLWTYIKRNIGLYILLIPAILYVIVFNILPMYGITLAFKDYDIFAANSPLMAIVKSPWVGLKYFIKIFGKPDFIHALRNTLVISVAKIVCVFPIPILFAILLNEVHSSIYQKIVQVVVYLPHFLSWAVVAGIFVSLLGSTGMVNHLITALGFHKVDFLMNNKIFQPLLVISDGWKEVGWSSIVYFAAIAGLDQDCFEAAKVDGANRFQRIRYVTLPGLMPTVILMLILRVGSIMDAGFSQIFAMYNPTVYASGDIIGTYIYRIGLGKMDFSTGAAVGLFNSIIALVLVLSSNAFAKKVTNKSIW